MNLSATTICTMIKPPHQIASEKAVMPPVYSITPIRVSLVLVITLLVTFSTAISAQEQDNSDAETTIITLTPEQIDNYQFVAPPQQITVEDLSMGQRAIMASQRRAAKDLIARRLGVVAIRTDRSDLKTFQQLVDRRVLRKTQVEEWQSIGILFGDILAKEFSLKWVSYEDEQGANKALRYRNTDNYIFPITLFSKRARFDEKIDMFEIYAKLESQIQEIVEFERRPQLPRR